MIITLILFLVFVTISALHFYWGFGGKWGSNTVIPTNDEGLPLFIPRTISTLIIATGLLGFGMFYLVKYGLITTNLPEWLNKYGFLIIISIFILRGIGDFNFIGLFKKHKSSEFAINDTKYYTPLCLVIVLLTLTLVLSN